MTQRKRRFLSLCPLIIAGISGPLFLRVPPAAAQGNFGGQIGLRMNEVQKSNFCEPTQRLQVTVINENKTHLDRQAIVKIHDKKLDITSWDTTSNEAEVTFCNIAFGDYEIDAAAVGYLAEHRELHLTGLIQERDFKLVMHKDPMAVDLNAPDRAMPANARRETKLAVNALRSSNFKEARKQLERAFKLAPANAQVNFLLGYLSMQNKEMDKAENYLSRSATLDPHNVQSLTLLGRVQLERKENDPAAKTLEQAVAIDSNALPPPGSVNANAAMISPLASGGSQVSLWPGVPHFRSAMDTIACTVRTPVRDEEARPKASFSNPKVTISHSMPP